MRDTLDILKDNEAPDCVKIMGDYFLNNLDALECYVSFPQRELIFHRGIFYNNELVGYCVYGLDILNKRPPDTTVFLLYVEPEYRQRGFGRMAIDALRYYQLPVSIFAGKNEWLRETDLAKEVRIV